MPALDERASSTGCTSCARIKEAHRSRYTRSPVVASLVALAAGTRTAPTLVLILPALSVPSFVVGERALGWRAATAMTGAVALGGVLAGALPGRDLT